MPACAACRTRAAEGRALVSCAERWTARLRASGTAGCADAHRGILPSGPVPAFRADVRGCGLVWRSSTRRGAFDGATCDLAAPLTTVTHRSARPSPLLLRTPASATEPPPRPSPLRHPTPTRRPLVPLERSQRCPFRQYVMGRLVQLSDNPL